MTILKPKILKKGDTIGLVSPSSPLAGIVQHRVDIAINTLEDLGFKVKLSKNSKLINDYTAGTAKERASDLNEMFEDEEVGAIMSFIGGFHSNQILEYLDFDLIKNNPKIFIGFSDISVLHYAIYKKTGLTTFYGPAALTQFGEKFGVDSYTLKYFKKALMSLEPIGEIRASKEWTDELLNWFDEEDLKRPREMKKNEGYSWIREGKCEGEILGGCITSLLHLRGTDFWPSHTKKIFFWEIPESSADFSMGEPVGRVDTHLTDLRLSGVFEDIVGMVIGRPKKYTPEMTNQLKDIILKNVNDFDFPILFNANIGHTDPIITLPIGVKASLSSMDNLFEIIESAVIK